MRRSWVNRKSTFPIILCLILMVHLISLMSKIQFNKTEDRQSKRPLVVKLQKLPELKQKKQIVESEDSESKEIINDAFLSDKDRSFDRQTRARKNDVFHQGKASGGKAQQGHKKVSLSDLGSAVGEDPFKKAAEEYTDKKNGLDPSPVESQKVSSTNDYLEEVPLGDMTNLNTVEYKYYGFYHRIKQKLEQFWGRSLYDKAEQMAKAGRRVPASEDLITSLQVTLDQKGEILAVKIIGTSGIKELDDAAIESFNEAGPFPNPPKELVQNGKVTLEWGFVVKS